MYLWQHPNDTYYAVWWVKLKKEAGYVWEKRRKSLKTKDRDEAQDLLVKEKKRQRSAAGGIQTDITWREFCEEYLRYSKTDHSHETFLSDERKIQKFNLKFDLQHPKDLTANILKDYKSILSDEGLKPSSINRHLSVLKAMARRAWEWGKVEDLDDRISTVKKIKLGKKKPYYWKLDEIAAVLAACGTDYQGLFCDLGLSTGMRKGEMANLKRKSCLLDEAKVWVEVSDEWHPKDKEGREIPIPDRLVERLRKWFATTKADYVLSTTTHKPKSTGFTTMLKRILKRANKGRDIPIKGSAHTMRHTYASQLANSGVDIATVAELLGHENLNITRIYYHVDFKTLQAAVKKLPF